MNPPQEDLKILTDSILLDYRQGRPIDLTHHTHPDRHAVTALTDGLLGIVYPGYFLQTQAPPEDTIWEVANCLHQQLFCVLPQAVVEACGRAFWSRLPRLRALAQTDVDAAFSGDPAAENTEEIIFCYPGLYAISVYRLANVLYGLQVPMIPRIMTEYAHRLTGIDIHPGATIGDHFFIDHGTGIVIGQTTVIGNHVKLYQGVTLGGLSTRGGQDLRGTKRHPTIEDRVTVYANASILGGDTVIGHDSIIGANAFITHSVPPCTTVTNQDQPLNFKLHHCEACRNTE